MCHLAALLNIMSLFAKILIWKCLLQVGVLGSGVTLTCPKGYLVEGMVSYDRSVVTGFFVCMQCRRDSAAFDAIEYCIERDFTKDLTFYSSDFGEFRKRKVKNKVERRKV